MTFVTWLLVSRIRPKHVLTLHVTCKESCRVEGVRSWLLQKTGECRVVKMERRHQINLLAGPRWGHVWKIANNKLQIWNIDILLFMAASWHMPYFKVATTTTGNSLLDILCLAGFNKVEMAFYDFFLDRWPIFGHTGIPTWLIYSFYVLFQVWGREDQRGKTSFSYFWIFKIQVFNFIV